MGTIKHHKVKYDPKKEVILANEIIENCRYSLSPHGFALLMGLGQSIDYTKELWPEFEVDINGLFQFFNLKKNNGKRYDVVQKAFENILDNPLKIRVNNKKWSGVPWLAYEYDEDISNRVRINFHEKAIPYLMAFKTTFATPGYTKMLPGFYTKFQTKYATWLYPFFKKWQDLKSYETVTVKKNIKWVREKTFTESSLKTTGELLREAVNKAISDINEHSDLLVSHVSKKNGNIRAEVDGSRAMSHIYFIISTKPEHKKEGSKKKFASEGCLRDNFSYVEELTPEMIRGIYATFGTFKAYEKEYKCQLFKITIKGGYKVFKCR